MHGKHVTIVDVGRIVRIQNLIRYEANTGFLNAEKPVLKPNRKTGSSGFFHTGTQPYMLDTSTTRWFTRSEVGAEPVNSSSYRSATRVLNSQCFIPDSSRYFRGNRTTCQRF